MFGQNGFQAMPVPDERYILFYFYFEIFETNTKIKCT